MLIRVAPATELEGSAVRVQHAGLAVLVTVIDGEPRAIDDVCPHNRASLAGGVIAQGAVTCPWHWWRFDLATGACLNNDGVRQRTFTATVADDGWVEVEIPEGQAPMSIRETLLAHARGEL